MWKQPKSGVEQRRSPRLKILPMYTSIRVRCHGHLPFDQTGHIYDVSTGGMRFELDHSLECGTHIDVQASLPGTSPTCINLSGHVVRYHEPDEVGPVRMGMAFDGAIRSADRRRLADYLYDHGSPQAQPPSAPK